MFSVFNKIKRSKKLIRWSVGRKFKFFIRFQLQDELLRRQLDGDAAADGILLHRRRHWCRPLPTLREKSGGLRTGNFFLLLAHSANVPVPQVVTCTHTHFRCSTLGRAPGLTDKHNSRLERSARDKHSSLLQTIVNYGRNSFITFKCL